MNNKPIIVMGPMDCEITDIENSLVGPAVSYYGGYRFTSGTIDNYPVITVRTLIGMVNASAAATLAITKHSPLCIIIQGTSGAHNPKLHKRDIVLGDNIIEHGSYYTSHRDAENGIDYSNREYPGAEVFNNDKYNRTCVFHSDKSLLSIALETNYEKGNVILGTISSADIWNKEIDYINYLHKTRGSDCEEMENFAVAQVCSNFNIPSLGIRIISNSELYPQEEFDESTGTICQEYTLEVIKNIIKQLK